MSTLHTAFRSLMAFSLGKSCCLADATADMDNGPEDLLLEELVRNWKWAAAQQHAGNRQRHPQLAGIRLAEEDDYAEPEDKIQFEPNEDENHREQKNFAYRPHDDRFRNHRPPEPARQIKTVNPLIQSAGRYFPAATKEAIFDTQRWPKKKCKRVRH